MKFHGITMVGPFVNQKLVDKPDPFVPDRDQGRLIWLTDGTLWYGSDTEWVNFSSGAGDASEVEDMYSDLLRTTIFMNASYDAFELDYDENSLVSYTDMEHDVKDKVYTYTANQYIESDNLYDVYTNMEFIDYILPSVDFVESGDPQIEVSSNGGVTWFTAQNNRIFRIPTEHAAIDLRMRFTGDSVGTLKSWGILYNKDLTAACTKYGLTYANFEATEGQSLFELNYVPNAIQVFLNGDLLDHTDYEATNGTDVIFLNTLHDGDIVYIISYSTSVINPNIDFNDYIQRDGSIVYQNNQPMGDNKLTGLADGVDPQDSITKQQLDDGLDALSGDIGNIDLTEYAKIDGSRPFTGDQSMGGQNITNMADAVNLTDAVTKSQLDDGLSGINFIPYTTVDGSKPFTGNQSMGGYQLTNVGNPTTADAVMSRSYADGRYLQTHTSSIERMAALTLIDLPSTAGTLPHNLSCPYDGTWTYDMTTHTDFASRRPPMGGVGAMMRVYIESNSIGGVGSEFAFYCYVNGELVARCNSSVWETNNSNSVDIFALPSMVTLTVRLNIVGSVNSDVDCAANVSHIGWYY